jgi:hypothetical protein
MTSPKIAIITMVIGADYTKAMEPGLESKRKYAKKHGYDLYIGGAEVWDRKRPIPWSKLPFMLKFLDDYDYLFWSDADVVIMNDDLKLETHIVPLLPPHKDLLWTKDVCGNLNSGNMLIRGKSAWVRAMFKSTYEQEDLIHHIWWENAGMIRVIESSPANTAKTETLTDFSLFNVYIFGPQNKATDPSARLYKTGDFLVHFAGVSNQWNIYRMMKYLLHCQQQKIPHDTSLLDVWYVSEVASKHDADKSLTDLVNLKK